MFKYNRKKREMTIETTLLITVGINDQIKKIFY